MAIGRPSSLVTRLPRGSRPGRGSTSARRVAVGLVTHHALGEETGEGLVDRHVAAAFESLGIEARIEQVQHRVLDAADVLIDRKPRLDLVGRQRLVGARGAEAREVPGGIHEGVHRVGVALRGGTAARARGVLPRGMAVEGIARRVEGHVLRQAHRERLARHRHHAARCAVHHRNRAAPVALPRDAPIAEPVADGRAAGAAFRKLCDGARLGVGDREPVQEVGIDGRAVADIGLVADLDRIRILPRRTHHGITGRPWARAKSRSRWSWAGQPKIAPVP